MQGAVPGKAGLSKPHLDVSEAAAANTVVAPKLATAMIGDRNDARTELALLERKAISTFEARSFMMASNCYRDLIKKLTTLDDIDTYWMDLTKAFVAMSRTRQRLGSMIEAQDWQRKALELLQEHQSEDPSDLASCTHASLRYHQSQAKPKKERAAPEHSVHTRQVLIQQKLLWAEVKIQEAAVMVARATDKGVNLYLEAFNILNSAATLLQEVLGPESSKVSSALCDMGQLQALRGRHRDALDIYKRALRIETRARGYDGYAAHSCIADILHSMAEINIIMGKYSAAIGLLQRACHIYSALDSRGHSHPKIPAVKECLGRAYQGCLRFGEASCEFQDGFDCSSKLVVLHEQQGDNDFVC